MENQKHYRTEVEKIIIEKAMKDMNFRESLINNPKETAEQMTGIKLPDEISIKVLEETGNVFFLVIPAMEPEKVELTDADLSVVSGGHQYTERDWTHDCTGLLC